MVIPRVIRRKPEAKWETVLSELNNLVYYARQQAVSTHKTYRLHFFTKEEKHKAIVEQEIYDKENKKIVYQQVKYYYFNPKYVFPSSITIESVYHGKIEQLEEFNDHAYCYVIPNG